MPNRTEDRPKVEAATGKSRFRRAQTWNLADLPRLARGSLYLGLVMALGGPSCLLTENPQFQGPEALGPFLRVRYPDPSKVLRIDKVVGAASFYPTVPVTFDIYSEDLGHPLYAYFRVDDVITAGLPVQIEPGHLGSTVDGGQTPPRFTPPMTFQMPPIANPRGCHTLTLFVQRTPDEIATVSWVLDVDDDDRTNLMSDCPGLPATVPPATVADAAADAGRDP